MTRRLGCWLATLTVLLGLGAAPARARSHVSAQPALRVGVSAVRAHSVRLQLTIRTSANARCRTTVSAGSLAVPLPDIVTTSEGRAVLRWVVESGAPSGKWTFRVRCTKAGKARSSVLR